MRRLGLFSTVALVVDALVCGALVCGALICSALICAGTAQAQVPNRPVFELPLVVEPDHEVTEALAEARQSMDRKEYINAVQLLQRVLDHPEDSFVEADFLEGRGDRGGVRKEAVRLLMSLPPDGQATYERAFGIAAKELLSKAIEADDMTGIREVARRFTATSAGYDALTLLAAQALDANRPLEAALLLEPLREHPRRTPQFWMQRAVCWTGAGRIERGLKGLKELRRTAPQAKLRIAGREVSLPDDDSLPKWLRSASRSSAVAETNTESWTMVGGGSTRNLSSTATSPVGGRAWRVSVLEHLMLDGRVEEDRRHRTRIQEGLDRVQQSLLEDNRPLLPAAQPLVIGDTVVYRTIADVTAVSLKTGELLWRSALVDESLVRLLNTRSIESRLRTSRGVTLQSHLERRTYRDGAAGTLSSDGQLVFALEELDGQGGLFESQPANKLVAYDLTGGRIRWEVGGPRGTRPLDLAGEYFLGPPLPVDDRLYVLSETRGALQLVVLKHDEARESVQQDWFQTLIAADRPVTQHLPRRLSGLSPSLAEGVLVCPTSSGAVVALDVARRALLWGYQYQSTSRPVVVRNFAGFQRPNPQDFPDDADRAARSMDGSPLIAAGRVLIAPRDSDQLFCLDLVDGREIWKSPRDGWMYIACAVDGRVVIVDHKGVKAVQLSDGTPAAAFETTDLQASGRGVRAGMYYHLPLTTGEMATIDLHNGNVLARSKLADKVAPGNLAAGGGAIVSLSANDLVGFASMASIERQIAAELKDDPQSPRALALRGELRLHRGEQAAGLADLRDSLQRKPDPRVKSVLAATLLAAARLEPARIHAQVAELESITDDPEQKNEYLRLYAQALETAGDRTGAFAQMIRLAGTSQFLDDLKPVDPGHSVRTDRSIRARLIEMYSAASPDDRAVLDRSLERHVRTVPQGVARAEHLEHCLRFFKGLPGVEASLLRIVQEIDGDERQELVRSFLGSADPLIAARATALRCHDLIQAKQWSDAAPLVKRLHDDFADRDCLEGQTGRSLAEQWSSRQELKPLLIAPANWPTGSIEVRRLERDAAVSPASLPAEVIARSGTQFVGWSFETDLPGTHLLARDASGGQRWKLALPVDDLTADVTRNMPIPCQIRVREHWMVVSRATFFVVVDASSPTAPRIVWQQSLRHIGAAMQDLPFNGRIRRSAPDYSTYGRVLGLTSECVIYMVGSKMMSGDLETGRLAWTRQDLGSNAQDATADERVVAVPSNGSMILLRTLDGTQIAKRSQQSGLPIWNSGSRQIAYRFRNGGLTVELRDLESDQVVWSLDRPVNSLTVVVDDEALAILEPSGQLAMIRLADGREQYRVELPLKLESRERSWFAVQRSLGRDLILAGEKTTQVVPFDSLGSQGVVAFNGSVCAVSSTDGKLQWTTPVERAAFDRTQPSSLPVLLLATRQLDRHNANAFIQRFRMSAEIIDKRTGRMIYATDETAPPQAPRLEPDPVHGRIVANFQDWQLDLTFPEAKAAEAKPADAKPSESKPAASQ